MYAFQKRVILILLIFSCSAIYLPGITGPFLFDDHSSITNNTALKIKDLKKDTLIDSAFSRHSGPLQRPIPMLSFALNSYFSKDNSAKLFKITNVVIHGINSILVFLFALEIFKLSSVKNRQTALVLASSTAILWCLHPINLTSVLYVVQRMTSLSTLFSLLTLVFYLRGRQTFNKTKITTKPLALFVLSFLAFIFAIYSKENALLLPCFILLLEAFFLKPKVEIPQQHKKAAFLLLLIITTAFTIYAFNYAAAGYWYRDFTMTERIMTQFRVITFYLSLIVIPRINAFGLLHDDILISTSLITPWTTLTSILLITGILYFSFIYRKKYPMFSFGVFWFFIGHILESTIFPLEIAHEHRNNFPSIGIIFAFISLLSTKKSRFILFSTTFCAIVLAASSGFRANTWGDYHTLMFYETRHHPQSPGLNAMYSNALHKIGDLDEAVKVSERTMQLDKKEPAYVIHHLLMLAEIGRPLPENIKNNAVERLHVDVITASTKGALLRVAKCLDKPYCDVLLNPYTEWINVLLEQHEHQAFLHYMKGKVAMRENNELTALNSFQRAHELDKNLLHPLFEMARILVRNGQFDRAEELINLAEKKNNEKRVPNRTLIPRLKKQIQQAKLNYFQAL